VPLVLSKRRCCCCIFSVPNSVVQLHWLHWWHDFVNR